MTSFLKKIYQHYFNFIAKKQLNGEDFNINRIHLHVAMTASGSVLMWLHVGLTFFHMDSHLVLYWGIAASLLGMVSTALFRLSNSIFLVTNIALFCGISFQSIFVFYSGGLISPVIAWLGVIPLLGGLVEGKRSVMLWSSTALLIVGFFTFQYLADFTHPNKLSKEGTTIAQMAVAFGLIIVATSTLYVYIFIDRIGLLQLKEQAQAEVKKSAKRAFKTLAIKISHEINNPLMIIRLKTQRLIKISLKELEQDLKESEKIITDGESIFRASDRIQTLMETLERMDRRIDPSRFQVEDIGPLVRRISDEYLELMKGWIDVSFDLEHSGFCLVDPQGLKIAITEVLKNAHQAAANETKPEIKISSRFNDHAVNIEIENSGRKISTDIEDRIFEPFYSKKDIQHGIGVGLTIAKREIVGVGNR